MTKNRDIKGPQFVRCFGPVIEALEELGGSGRPAEVKELVIEKLGLAADEVNETLRDGVPPIELVDGEKLIEMCETLEFGLKPRQTFDVDREFFTKFGGVLTEH
jgi:hypothetical protein